MKSNSMFDTILLYLFSKDKELFYRQYKKQLFGSHFPAHAHQNRSVESSHLRSPLLNKLMPPKRSQQAFANQLYFLRNLIVYLSDQNQEKKDPADSMFTSAGSINSVLSTFRIEIEYHLLFSCQERIDKLRQNGKILA